MRLLEVLTLIHKTTRVTIFAPADEPADEPALVKNKKFIAAANKEFR